MTTKIYDSFITFLNRKDKDENGVSKEFAAAYSNYVEDNNTAMADIVRCAAEEKKLNSKTKS